MLLLAMLLCFSALFAAGFISTCDACKVTDIQLKIKGSTLSATLAFYNTTMDIEHSSLGSLQESYDSAQLGNTEDSYDLLENEDLDLDSLFEKVQRQVIYPENAEIYFYYYKTEYDTAQSKSISTRVDIECLEGENPRMTDATGTANCTIPEEVYKDTCTMAYASFCNPDLPSSDICSQVKPSGAQAYLCGEKSTAMDNLAMIVRDNLVLPAPVCFLSIILGGLLLASMFFSGRSPLSLLDITTPLLPKAKSISYGGISMGTGITRMGRAADMMVKEIEKSSEVTFHELAKFYRQSTGFNARLLSMIMDSGASSSMKMIALRALMAGRGEREVRKILKIDAENADQLRDTLGPTIAAIKSNPDAQMKKWDNLDERIVLLSEQRILIEMQKKSFSLATGQVPKGFMNKVKQTIGSLPVVGDHFRGFTASAFFGARQLKTMYSSFGKGVARTAIGREGMDRIQMSVDAERARGGKPGGFAGWVALSQDEKNLVTLFNVYEKGSALYKSKLREAQNDILNWLVRKILEKRGASLNLNEEEVLKIGLMDPRELMFSRMRAGDFARIEKELRAILSRQITKDFDAYSKMEHIMHLMMREGIQFDRAGVLAAMAALKQINSSTDLPKRFQDSSEYLNREAVLNSYRLIRLQRYLEGQFKVNEGAVDLNTYFGDKFYFSIGRPDLKYTYYDERGNMRVLDQTFSTYFLNKYRQALESSKPGDKNPVSLIDIANYCFLRVVNERWGLIDPTTPGLDAKVKGVMERARNWLISLIDPEQLKSLGRTPSMSDLTGKLYAPDERYTGDAIADAGHGTEHGPAAGVWRVNMSAHWRTFKGPMGGARTTVENQSYKEVYYSHTMPKAVQSMVQNGVSQERALQIYLGQVTARNLFERMKSIMEMDAQNAYFSSQREFEHFHNILGAYKEYLARKQGRKEFEITDREVEKLISKPIGVKELSADSWIRLREGSWVPFSQKYSFKLAQSDRVVNAMAYVKQDGVWKEFMPEKLMGDSLFKKRMRMLGEFEDISPASNEVLKRYHNIITSLQKGAASKAEVSAFIGLVADFAKAEGKDTRKGAAYTSILLRLAVDPELSKAIEKMGISVERDLRLAGTGFADAIRGGVLANKYLDQRITSDERDEFAKQLRAWASEGSPQDNRQMRVALLFYNHGSKANDMKHFNTFEEGIRIAPMGMKSFTTESGAVEQVGGVRNWLRNFFKPIHMELEQFTLSAFAKQTRAQYESSIISEYYRETGAKFAGKLLAGEFGRVDDRNSPAMNAYNSLADAFGRYHAIWDETITRDPRGNSSAIGHSFIFSSFFHHGPGMPFGPRFYQRWITPGKSSSWHSGENLSKHFKYLQMTPQMFNWMLAAPFIGGYRTFLTSKFGYPSKYDRNYLTREAEQANVQYRQAEKIYEERFRSVSEQLAASGVKENVPAIAARMLNEQGIVRPEKPMVVERDTMDPFMMSTPRDKDSWRALTNWFYASFDPTSTNMKRNLSRLFSPLTAFVPFAPLHAKVLGGEWNFADTFHNPYYVSPQTAKAQLLSKFTGPMIKRQYGGTEILTGVVRAPEDMWAFHAGVNVIWGNANPGMSYIDFGNALQMDPRVANYLRYESRFRPYFSHDEYVEKQANLGIAKREIDPTRMMLERNAELRQYRAPTNRLYQFLNPATFIGYKAEGVAKRAKRFFGDAYDFAEGLATYDGSNRGVTAYGSWGLAKANSFAQNIVSKQKIQFTTELRYCSCGSAMPANGVCPACSQKMRCPHCDAQVSPHQTHVCQHGLRRNLLMDDMQSDGALGGMNVWRNSSRWGRGI